MPVIEKKKRNLKIVELHGKNPALYTYTKLGKMYNIDRTTVCKVFLRYKNK